MTLIYISCAWVAGILLGTNADLPLALILLGLIPLPLLFFARQHKKSIILMSLVLFAFFAAAPYAHSSLYRIDERDLRLYNDSGTVEIKGMVAKAPEVRDKSTHLSLSATEIKLDNEWREVAGNALLFVPRYPGYEYGDTLMVTGILETPPRLDDFDYKGYLAHQGIYATMLFPEIEILERGKRVKPLEWVYSLRNHLAETLARAISEPQASLAQGILLGMRGAIPLSLKTDFIHTGTIHLLAISELHLSIVAGIMLSLGVWFFGRRRHIHIWLALATIWLYALLTGMHPPVVRGAIMASLFLTAELLGRQHNAITALTFAAAIMVGISPYILGDAAFQLSFLAMTGLIFLFPTFRSWGRKTVRAMLGENGAIASIANFASDSFSITMAAIIVVWPVVAHYFGIVSLVGPLATFLVLPALPAIIITGALTGFLGFIALPAAQIMGWLAWLVISYMMAVVSGLATPSLSSIEVGSVNSAFIWTYYAALAAAIWFKSNRRKLANIIPKASARLRSGTKMPLNLASKIPVKWVIPPLLVIAVLVSFTAATMPDDKLHVSFLSVGEGDAIFIQQGNQQILIDGGASPQAISLELGDKMPFWDRSIDLVILTHPHQDHLTGLVEVLQRFRVKQVLYPDSDYESPMYDEWLKTIEENKIESTIAQSGLQINLSQGTVIEVLNPPLIPMADTQSDVDNNGVVLRLSKGDISFLLTADIMQEAEWELIRNRADLTSTVLKVAHHGSDTSTTAEFLTVVAPRLAVISAGADNRFGHPSDEVLARLRESLESEDIYRTDRHGTIEFITDGERLWVEVGR